MVDHIWLQKEAFASAAMWVPHGVLSSHGLDSHGRRRRSFVSIREKSRDKVWSHRRRLR